MSLATIPTCKNSKKSFYLWDILAQGLVDRLQMLQALGERIAWIGPSATIMQQWLSTKERSYQLDIINDNLTPLSDNNYDVIIVNSVLSWFEDPLAILNMISHVLAADGLLMFSVLGPNTLLDIQLAAEQYHLHPDNKPLIDMHHWGDMLLKCHYKDPVVDRADIQIAFNTVADWFSDWQQFHIVSDLPKANAGFISPRKWQKLLNQIQNNQSIWQADFELIYGMAYKPEQAKQMVHNDGSVSISLDSLKASLQKQ